MTSSKQQGFLSTRTCSIFKGYAFLPFRVIYPRRPWLCQGSFAPPCIWQRVQRAREGWPVSINGEEIEISSVVDRYAVNLRQLRLFPVESVLCMRFFYWHDRCNKHLADGARPCSCMYVRTVLHGFLFGGPHQAAGGCAKCANLLERHRDRSTARESCVHCGIEFLHVALQSIIGGCCIFPCRRTWRSYGKRVNPVFHALRK